MFKDMCLGKHFWKDYLGDSAYNIAKCVTLAIMVGLFVAIFRTNPLPFIMGWLMTDPFSYYIMEYLPRRESIGDI